MAGTRLQRQGFKVGEPLGDDPHSKAMASLREQIRLQEVLKKKCLDLIKWKSHGSRLLQWLAAVEAEIGSTEERLDELDKEVQQVYARMQELELVKREFRDEEQREAAAGAAG